MIQNINFQGIFFDFLNKHTDEIKSLILNKFEKIDFDRIVIDTLNSKVTRLANDLVNDKINQLISDEFKLKLKNIINDEFIKNDSLFEKEMEYFVRKKLFKILSEDNLDRYFYDEWDEKFIEKLSSLLGQLDKYDKENVE